MITIVRVVLIQGGLRKQLGFDEGGASSNSSSSSLKRASKSEDADPDSKGPRDRNLDAWMKDLFKSGRLSGPVAAEGIRAGARLDEPERKVLKKWSAAGGGGKYEGNIHRDLLSKMSNKPETQLYSEHIPFWDKVQNVQYKGECYFNLPHEELDERVGNTSTFEWCFLEEEDPIYTVRRAWCADPDVKIDEADVGRTAAIGLWGDSAVMSHRDSLIVLLYNVLSGACACSKYPNTPTIYFCL